MTTPLHQLKAEFFKTLSHPLRIRVLELLSQDEHSVGELLREMEVEPSNLSQQLAVLRRAGLVATRKEGSTVHYSLISPQIAELMAVARSILTSVLSEQASMLTTLKSDARTARGNQVRRGAR
jgi:DNA-binding transcriptional ArsR family regulator